jgi:hypothetical protein
MPALFDVGVASILLIEGALTFIAFFEGTLSFGLKLV